MMIIQKVNYINIYVLGFQNKYKAKGKEFSELFLELSRDISFKKYNKKTCLFSRAVSSVGSGGLDPKKKFEQN